MKDAIQTGFNLLKSTAKAGNKWTQFVRDETKADDYSVICAIADKAVASVPVRKGEDGKDENAKERNDLVRTIRRALSIVGKERGQKLKIKQVEGAHQVSIEAADAKGTEAADGSDEGEDIGLADEAEQDALWSALDVVLANLANPAILSAIQDGLKKLAKSAKN